MKTDALCKHHIEIVILDQYDNVDILKIDFMIYDRYLITPDLESHAHILKVFCNSCGCITLASAFILDEIIHI